ncbi:MAG: hypothetical protein EOL98_11035 [Negativicutes bacterium]|nr:hypothetical protein [Negativicutes bacterium]
MKAKVIKRFKDKHTGERFLPGDLFDGETARIKELKDRGFVEEVVIEEVIETSIDFTAYSKKELQAMLDKKGIEYANKMTKNELLELLGGE